jgi:hypothetical protein
MAEGAERVIQDRSHADRGREVVDRIGRGEELAHQRLIRHTPFDKGESGVA